MSDRAAIVPLARLIGVEAHYTDAFGETREVSDETLLALIGAFGLPSDPVRARRELEEQQRSTPLGLSAAHLVHAEDKCPELALRLPAGCREIQWTCHLEDGEESSGRVARRKGTPFAMPLPPDLPLGYHQLELDAAGVTARTNLIVAPDRCYLPAEFGPGARSWGLNCPLYGLRGERNWGMGDFTDLAALARAAGSRTAPRQSIFALEPNPARLSLY